ncbi:hypothetical protein GCM10010992_01680 [Cloacibacterium rupense]|uniref:Uncharacterized protein n=1 Tax=Cloacibacterium rupense TaxID=517423 RepID=A0ABQ2NG31_9FLAO|nr:hypothetical protein [Cloacibacterium rupense]GGP01412.1 hypothetical protein GCM10010992_01680 [Cloacibacterium rupense]
MKKKYIETEITSLKQKEWIKQRIYNNIEIDYLTLIYGFILNPPLSKRKDENSITIHCFFVNEYEIAQIFKKICEKLVEKLNLNNDLILYKSDAGHSEIESSSLTKYFKKINFEEKFAIFSPYNYFSNNNNLNDKQKFSYLLGKYIRYYRERKFVILESWESYVLLDILKSFCISQDELESKTYFGTPGSTHIYLNQDSTLLEYLEYWRNKIIE